MNALEERKMSGNSRRSRLPLAARQRGQVLIIVGLSLAVLIGAVGLAID